MGHRGPLLGVSDEWRVNVPIPEGFETLAHANERSIASEAKIALREHLKREKEAKRLANKRPTTKTKTRPWRPFWNSARGPIRRLNEKPYKGKSDRRRVIKERRERKKT